MLTSPSLLHTEPLSETFHVNTIGTKFTGKDWAGDMYLKLSPAGATGEQTIQLLVWE